MTRRIYHRNKGPPHSLAEISPIWSIIKEIYFRLDATSWPSKRFRRDGAVFFFPNEFSRPKREMRISVANSVILVPMQPISKKISFFTSGLESFWIHLVLYHQLFPTLHGGSGWSVILVYNEAGCDIPNWWVESSNGHGI
jgi:hypothetical protein